MRRCRRIFIILLLGLNIFTLAGCWDRNELEDLAIVSGVGIEKGSQGKIRVVVQIINTGALTKGVGSKAVEFEKGYRNAAAEGDTIYDALNNLGVMSPFKINLSHTTLFIISEDLARGNGLKDILDFLERDPQIRFDGWVIIGRGSLTNMLDVVGRITTTPADRIANMIKFHHDNFSYVPLKLAEFIRLTQSESSQPYTGVVEIQPNLSLATEPGHEILNGNVPEPVENIVMNGTAIFNKDKMIGWLNQEESRGLMWLIGEVKAGNISFSIPGKEGIVVTSVVRAGRKLKPEIIDGQPYITAEIEVESFLFDNQAGVDIDNISEVEKMETAQGEQVKREVEDALRKAQEEYKADVFGFGEVIHRKYPGEWQRMKDEWPEIFPSVQVDVKVKSLIQHTALTSRVPEVK